MAGPRVANYHGVLSWRFRFLEGQTDWLNATENQHIHERMMQSATENVQSAKKMLDHWLEQQPGRADSSEGFLARKIDELKEEFRQNEAIPENGFNFVQNEFGIESTILAIAYCFFAI